MSKEKMRIPIKLLSGTAKIPTYKYQKGSSGMDLSSDETVTLSPGEIRKVRTGIAVCIPYGYEMQIRNKSGISSDYPLGVIFGTIDAGYTGEIHIQLENKSRNPFGMIWINKGDQVAQGVIAPVQIVELDLVEELPETERGVNGFGSAGTLKMKEKE